MSLGRLEKDLDNPSTNDWIGDIDTDLIDQKMAEYDRLHEKYKGNDRNTESSFEPDEFLDRKNVMEYSWDEDKGKARINWPKHEGFVVHSTSQLALDKAATEQEYQEIEEALESPIPEDNQEISIETDLSKDISEEQECFENLSTAPKSMFDGDPDAATMEVGKILWRYGSENGYYLTDENTPIENVSLPYDAPLHRYRVEKNFDYIDGEAKAAFNKPGGGKQYLTGREFDSRNPIASSGGRNIAQLIEGGYLVEVDMKGKPIHRECDQPKRE